MLTLLDYIHILVFSVLVTWVLVELPRIARKDCRSRVVEDTKAAIFAKVAVSCNALVSLSYLGFCVHGILKQKTISLAVILLALSWILVTLFSLYCAGVHSTWPLVLVCWWVFCTLCKFLFICFYLYHLVEGAALPPIFRSASVVVVEFASFLYRRRLFHRFSDESFEDQFGVTAAAAVGGREWHCSGWLLPAGCWSRLTFRWLNPEGRKARTPAHSDSSPVGDAERAYSLLQESLRSEKPELFSPLPRAIFRAVWKPLAVNAIFAGNNS
ncbi:hypothetical protein ACMD2_02625 [Ananas comosus]|uniref:Uncharacterized protein n=1 Tax=Ananas comosus TaxID=4615 RepID=A0A199V832_ANACO|nr:hypothetical protein ACMD2_02625 [Ananas comosus]